MGATADTSLVRNIALMGYPFVGKSSIALGFVLGHFPDAYDTTIEDLHHKRFNYYGRNYILNITDTAGQQEYSMFPRSCYVGMDGFVLVYAINDRRSFEIIQVIHHKIMDRVGDASVPIVVVGNKADLAFNSRVVSEHEGRQLARAWKAAFMEISAKDLARVGDVFEQILHKIEISRCNIVPRRTRNNGCIIM